jgi:WD40 repeat protein
MGRENNLQLLQGHGTSEDAETVVLQIKFVLKGHTSWVNALAWMPEPQLIASGV